MIKVIVFWHSTLVPGLTVKCKVRTILCKLRFRVPFGEVKKQWKKLLFSSKKYPEYPTSRREWVVLIIHRYGWRICGVFKVYCMMIQLFLMKVICFRNYHFQCYQSMLTGSIQQTKTPKKKLHSATEKLWKSERTTLSELRERAFQKSLQKVHENVSKVLTLHFTVRGRILKNLSLKTIKMIENLVKTLKRPFSTARSSYELRFGVDFGLDQYFGNLIWILKI